MDLRPRDRSGSNRQSAGRIRSGICLIIIILLAVGFAGTIVTAGSLWTNGVGSELRLVEARLSRRVAHRAPDPAPGDAAAGDHDDYVELLVKTGVAHPPRAH